MFPLPWWEGIKGRGGGTGLLYTLTPALSFRTCGSIKGERALSGNLFLGDKPEQKRRPLKQESPFAIHSS